jgi:hypothetical protein
MKSLQEIIAMNRYPTDSTARLHAAEALLELADAVIEILLGDARHEHAQEIRAAIERHWQQYPDPEGP